MYASVDDIYRKKPTPEDLLKAFQELESGVKLKFKDLDAALRLQIHSRDPQASEDHAAFILSQMEEYLDVLLLVEGFLAYTEGMEIAILPLYDNPKFKEKSINEDIRKAWKASHTGPWEVLVKRMVRKLNTMNHHINLAKKVISFQPANGVSTRWDERAA